MKLTPTEFTVLVKREAADGEAETASIYEAELEADDADDAAESEEAAGAGCPADDDAEGSDEADADGEYDEELDADPDDFEEADSEADSEPDADSEGEVGEPIDWMEVFGGDASWDEPKPGELDAAKAVAKEINDAVKKFEAGLPSYDKPYAVHPVAASRDQILIYGEEKAANIAQYQADSLHVSADAKSIASQLRRVLFTRSVDARVHDQRRGKLDRRKLATVNTPGKLTPNKRIFSQKVEGTSQDVAIGILVDQSGSMAHGKIACARQAAIAFGDALNQLTPLGIQFGVWGFDADWDRKAGHDSGHWDRLEPLRFHWYKGLAEDWNKVAPRIGQMEAHQDNVDGESVRWAAQQLLAAKASRRVLFVLSDGMPAGASSSPGGPGRLNADLNRAVEQCEAAGVEMIGVGFMSDAVKDFYPKHTVVNNGTELGEKILGLIRDCFGIRSGRRSA